MTWNEACPAEGLGAVAAGGPGRSRRALVAGMALRVSGGREI